MRYGSFIYLAQISHQGSSLINPAVFPGDTASQAAGGQRNRSFKHSDPATPCIHNYILHSHLAGQIKAINLKISKAHFCLSFFLHYWATRVEWRGVFPTFSLHKGYGESVSRLKNLVVFVPALNKYSAGKPCVCEIYRICKKKMRKRSGLFLSLYIWYTDDSSGFEKK